MRNPATQSWKAVFSCSRAEAEGLLALDALQEGSATLVAAEVDEASDRWQVEAYFDHKPRRAELDPIMAGLRLSGSVALERLPDEDWVALSQAGLEPVRAGRFHVHTGSEPADRSQGIVNFRIDAGQAFGTGHHETTAGCLAELDRLHRRGARFRTIIDVGTGTGLLALAARHLWRQADVLGSDIDPVSVRVSAENAAANGVRPRDRLWFVVADGTRHPAIHAAAPYDLVIANILAGPLVTLAPALAQISAPGTTLLLAGLLSGQREAVVAAYRRQGFRLDAASGDPQWPVLRLTMRRRHGHRRPVRAHGGALQKPGDHGEW